jgi:hypothetical protein
VIGLLRSLRSLVFGETWTIPLGVGTTLLLAAALRSALSTRFWHQGGGFVMAGLVAATLALSLWIGR